jgi:hypothetical protein
MVEVSVQMLAFGQEGEIRKVQIPHAGGTREQVLDRVFRWGQNEFQQQPHPSVSCGDVIRLGGQDYMVVPFGFVLISEAELAEYKKVPQNLRTFWTFDFFDRHQKLHKGE